MRQVSQDSVRQPLWTLLIVLVSTFSMLGACYPNPDDLRGGRGGGTGGVTGGSCTNPDFPRLCPAIADAESGCFSQETVCSTVVRCGEQQHACKSASLVADCVSPICVPASDCPVFDDATPLEMCSTHKCCSLWAECLEDKGCSSADPENPILIELTSCTDTYCGHLAASGGP